MPPAIRAAAIALLAFLVLLTGGTVTLELGPDRPSAAPAPTVAPAPDRETNAYADRVEAGDPHDHDARAEEIPGLSDLAERAAADANDELAAGYDTSGILQGAAPQPSRGNCPQTTPNKSSRNGAKLLTVFVHVTVSPNIAGTRDGEGICEYLSRPSVQASATWIVDNEGNSWLQVPVSLKPWTQAFFNPWSVSIEFIGYAETSRAQWTDAQLREGARLAARVMVRHGIPARRGKLDGSACKILKAGIVTHLEGGRCAGGHVDPGPAFAMDRFMRYIRAYTKTVTPARARAARGACRKLNWHRARARRDGHWSRARGARARQLKSTIRRGRVTCTG